MIKDNPRQIAVEIIQRVFSQKSYADILLEKALAKSNMMLKDKALCTELVYGTIRWKMKLEFIVKRQFRGKWDKAPEPIKWILITALYQMLYLDKIPDYAIVNQAVALAKKNNINGHWGGVVNGILRTFVRDEKTKDIPGHKDKVEALALKWSHPGWMIQKWTDTWGSDKAILLCKANNRRPNFGLRVNPLRTNREDLLEILISQGFDAQFSRYLDNFIIVKKISGLTESEWFKKGHFSIQDESSALVVQLLNAAHEEKIVDLAAAPGGKTFCIAEQVADKADIIACDIHRNRLKMLIRGRKRLGFLRVFPILSNCMMPGLSNSFDKVLLDAPCSGLGVLRRRVELRWHRQEKDIDKIISVQRKLIDQAALLVRPGGCLIYSTCSIQPEENEEVISDFLETHSDFQLERAESFLPASVVTPAGMMRTWPDIHGIDGAFAARLQKKE